MNSFTKSEIILLKSKINLKDFIARYVPLKKVGESFKGACPFHKGYALSFIVSPRRSEFHCYICGESGDVITFAQKYFKFTFVHAVIYLKKVELAILLQKCKGIYFGESPDVRRRKIKQKV